MKRVIIGIAGGTASGKTTLARKLFETKDAFGKVSLLRLDDYYKDRSHLKSEDRDNINYDHPDSFDVALLLTHLNDLKAGKTIKKPIYDFETHTRLNEYELLNSNDVIILEGIMIFAIKEILQSLDIKIYIDTPDDIRFIRRLKRDSLERNRSLDHIIKQYLETVRPMHLQFVEPSKRYADIIIPEGGNNNIANDIIMSKILLLLVGKEKN